MDKVNWSVANGEQPVSERYKATRRFLIRRAFNGKGVAIVKSTEQAGKFTLNSPFRILWNRTQVITLPVKKKTKKRLFLNRGTKSTYCYWERTENAEDSRFWPTVMAVVKTSSNFWVFSWWSRAGVVTVKGMADGREVEARVEILATAKELPTVKRVAPGTDGVLLDKHVSISVTDGKHQEYEVDMDLQQIS